jgi:hypothetical protein
MIAVPRIASAHVLAYRLIPYIAHGRSTGQLYLDAPNDGTPLLTCTA